MDKNWKCLLVLLCGLLHFAAFAQDPEVEEDTTRNFVDVVKDSRVSKELLRAITRKPREEGVFILKSEEIYRPFDGKLIRNIIINHIGFDKSITDTTRNLKNTSVKIANALHKNTKEWVIRDHLLFAEKKQLNPYTLADNERFLRDLDFIVDARIFVVPLSSTEDSVDVLVITRDVFSIGGRVSPRSLDKFSFRLYDVNVMGAGQRMQFNGFFDQGRHPKFGYETLYRKSSVAGSLINLTASYTQLNNGSSYGDEQETAFYLRLDRPLVSAYSRLAGGLELSRNWSQNFYNEADSVFRDYRYNVSDVWVGYNFGVHKRREFRSRRFVSVRFFENRFRRPEQSFDQNNPAFNTRTAALGAFTLFRQEFYKTQYVYGFGRTEDVPYGQTYSLLAGWQSLLGESRPYVGFDVEKSFVQRRGDFYNFSLRVGAFPYNRGLEDAAILLSGELFSKLNHWKQFMIRTRINADVSYLFNQETNRLLDMNGIYGLEGFTADSLLGTKRLHARYELVVYTPWKLLGFHFAPMAFFDVGFIAPKGKMMFHDKPYAAIGAGVRTRNENLVFGTVEIKFFYFPRQVENDNAFKIRVTSNLRIKYSASFVQAPSFIIYD
ncbi:MAG: hypothetical protein WKF87_11495 [Chryseolinea sp.]